MKQITNKDDLIAYDKIYLIQWDGSAHLATWTPKHGSHFSTMDWNVAEFGDVRGIVELCDSED